MCSYGSKSTHVTFSLLLFDADLYRFLINFLSSFITNDQTSTDGQILFQKLLKFQVKDAYALCNLFPSMKGIFVSKSMLTNLSYASY